tara:strand:- start:2422 stop:3582 length:1161 start_codon:yes stop_codon:yes gene_type:complete
MNKSHTKNINKLKIQKNRIRKLRTLSLGNKSNEFESSVNDKKKLIDLCSNDYLALSRDIDVISKAHEISITEGLGSGSSRFISGSRPIHSLLEKKLAGWLNQERVLLFPSGFQANIAAIQSLANRNSVVIADKLIHNSLLVGVKASSAKLIRFLHNDLDDLEKKLLKFKYTNKHIVVVIESLYSMEGSIAPIKQISELCKNHNAQLIVDEAHALGVLGQEGRGLSFNYRDSIDIISGTFGKSFGSGGAFLASNNLIGDYIIQTSGAFRYTTALSPSLAGGALKSLEIIQKNKDWGINLLKNSRLWKEEIQKSCDFKVIGDCQIISIIVGKEDEAVNLQKYLEKNGFLAIAIRPPTVPEGLSRIRLTIRKNLDRDILQRFLTVLKSY